MFASNFFNFSKSLTRGTAGRAVQGVGGAGVSVLGNIIISDITTVRERGKYMAIVFAAVGLGLALGPPLGGVMAESDWRWVFVRISKNLIRSPQRATACGGLLVGQPYSSGGSWDTSLTSNENSGSIFLSAAFP